MVLLCVRLSIDMKPPFFFWGGGGSFERPDSYVVAVRR